MNWFIKLISTEIFQSIVAGVILLMFGEYLKNFVLEPIREYKGVVGKIDNKLKYYANIITNSGLPNVLVQEARNTLRDLSCDLESIYKQIPPLFTFGLPSRKQISNAASKLIYLSNAAGNHGEELRNDDKIKETRDLLGIESL